MSRDGAPRNNAGTGQGAGPLIEVEGLTKRFPISRNLFRKATGYIHAVDGVSLHLARGESVGIVGESGCGKTTIGKLLVKLLEPDEGAYSSGFRATPPRVARRASLTPTT